MGEDSLALGGGETDGLEGEEMMNMKMMEQGRGEYWVSGAFG